MDIHETIAQIKSQLAQIEHHEAENQQEQSQVTELIVNLETELKQWHRRRDELDEEALKLYTQAEELKPKLGKLERIANLSKDFLELHHECQDSEDLLSTLYSSVSTQSKAENSQALLNSPLFQQEPIKEKEEKEEKEPKAAAQNYSDYSITIDEIRQTLPNAEKIYQKLVANYLEEYKTYQNFIVDGLDVIWYAVAFIAFGRSSYRKMSFKYHPDLDGSERAMQLVNTAWAISQKYLGALLSD